MEHALTFEQMKAQFPDEWLLLANPEFKNAKPMKGVLLAHGRDYLELCYQSQGLTAGYLDSTIVFTGEPQTNNRKWLKAIRSTEPPKTV